MSGHIKRKEEKHMMDYSYTIEEAKEEIKESVKVYFSKDTKGNYRIPQERQNPFYLVGAPGIGKTQMVREIAEEIGCGFYATSLTHHTRNSILGLPVIRGDEVRYTEYTMPEMLAVIEEKYKSGQKEGLLLLDEFASMPESLVAPMLAFLQNKTIGNHSLPKGWVLILSSNPPEYNRTARSFDAAIMDRVRVMELEYSRNDFLSYAEQKNLHPSIQEFVKTHGDMAYVCSQGNSGQEIVTARGWENLSDCLYGYEAKKYPVSYRLIHQFLKSDAIASQFFQYYSLRGSCLTTRDIFQILDGAATKEYADCLTEASFDEKWRTASLVKTCLSERCRRDADAILQLDILVTLSEVMESVAKKDSGFTNFHQCLSDYLGYDKLIGQKNILFDSMEDDRLATVIKDQVPTVLEEIHAQLKELASHGQNIFGNRYCSNEEMMDLVRLEIKDYQKQAEEAAGYTDEMISCGICFVKEISQKECGLFNGFINMIGKDHDILRVLSFRQNAEYVKALKQMGSGEAA